MEAKAITSSFLPADSWHSHGIQHTWDYSVASVYSPKNHLPLTCFRQLWGTTAAISGTDWASLWPTWVPGSWAALRELPLSFLNFDSPALPSALEAPKPCIKPLPSWNTSVFCYYDWTLSNNSYTSSEGPSWAIFSFISIRCHCSK